MRITVHVINYDKFSSLHFFFEFGKQFYLHCFHNFRRCNVFSVHIYNRALNVIADLFVTQGIWFKLVDAYPGGFAA